MGLPSAKKGLFPLDTRDYISTSLLFPICVLSAACGMGGGPLFLPVFILISNYPPEYTIPLSKSMIVGVSIAQLIINLPRKHPIFKTLPLIDFNTALVLEPSTIMGTVLGVFLNSFLPNWIILLLIGLTLLSLSIRSVIKAVRFTKREKKLEKSLLSSDTTELLTASRLDETDSFQKRRNLG